MQEYESVFISDTHLGMKNIDSKKLLSFLCSVNCKNLYLVGDIIDIWAMKKRLYWPSINSEIINTIYQKFLSGTNIYYIPGNHDDIFENIKFEVKEERYFFSSNKYFIYKGLNDKKYLVTHGDIYDSVITKVKWLAYMGALLYDITFYLNNKISKLFKTEWSLSCWSKRSIKHVISFLDSYEKTIVNEIKKEKLDGIICGHIHHPRIAIIDNIEYMNCGDFVESFSALVENKKGEFSIINL